MDLHALRLAAELGGQLLIGPTPAHTLVLLEQLRGHGLPSLLVLGRAQEDLAAPLAALTRTAAQLNLVAVLPTQDTQLSLALPFHQRRLGSLLGALDASLPWLEDRPMMVKRLPGRLRAARPLPLASATLRPLERADLVAHLRVAPEALASTFLQPPWSPEEGAYVAPWWPGVPKPAEAEPLVLPLILPSHTQFSETLRSAMRMKSDHPIPWLPHPGDPSPLHALALLTAEIAAFRGPQAAWCEALQRLAELPAPPHFCARC